MATTLASTSSFARLLPRCICPSSSRRSLSSTSSASAPDFPAPKAPVFRRTQQQDNSNNRENIDRLLSVVEDANSTPAASGSVVARYQDKQRNIQMGLRENPYRAGTALQPGDINFNRMFSPQAPPRSGLASIPLGPSRSRSLQTDYLLRNGGIDPLRETMNPFLVSKFVTNMGKIMNRQQTQLTWKNQRRVGKAVRRARSLGLMPYFADWSDMETRQKKYVRSGIYDSQRDEQKSL